MKMPRLVPRTILVLLVLAPCISVSASEVAAEPKGEGIASMADKFLVAPEKREVTAEEAAQLSQDGGYKMVMTSDPEGEKIAYLFKTPEDLKGILPDLLIDRLGGKGERDKFEEMRMGRPYPPLQVTDVAGTVWNTEDLRGKVVVLNYWFMECAPCVAELPVLNRIVEKYAGQEVVFLALTFDSAEELAAFLPEHPFAYHVASVDHAYFREIGSHAFPTHVVVSPTGMVTAVSTGLDSTAALEARLAGMIDHAREGS